MKQLSMKSMLVTPTPYKAAGKTIRVFGTASRGCLMAGFDAEHAAKSWAERYDSDGNHSIVGGAEVVVFVALDQDGSTPERFEVSGEVNPVYYARSLKDSE